MQTKSWQPKGQTTANSTPFCSALSIVLSAVMLDLDHFSACISLFLLLLRACPSSSRFVCCPVATTRMPNCNTTSRADRPSVCRDCLLLARRWHVHLCLEQLLIENALVFVADREEKTEYYGITKFLPGQAPACSDLTSGQLTVTIIS